MIRSYIDGYWYYSWEGIKKALQKRKEKNAWIYQQKESSKRDCKNL